MKPLYASLLCFALFAAVSGCDKKSDSDASTSKATTTTTIAAPVPPMPADTSAGTAANPGGAPAADDMGTNITNTTETTTLGTTMPMGSAEPVPAPTMPSTTAPTTAPQ